MQPGFEDVKTLLSAITTKLIRYLPTAHQKSGIRLNPARRLNVAARVAAQTVNALLFFLHNEKGEATGENYVRCCGALQSAIVLQDCISVIEAHLGQHSQKSTSAYKELRNVRNWTFGHPTDKKLKEYSGLCLVALDDECRFKLTLRCFIFKDDDDNSFPETLEVNIKELLNHYATTAETVLRQFDTKLAAELAKLES